MAHHSVHQQPLTNEEKALLLQIYRTRRYLLLTATAIMICMIIYIVWTDPALYSIYPEKKLQKYDFLISQKEMMYGFFTVFVSLIGGYGLWLYFKRVRPLRLDVRNGYKEAVSYRIIRKQYFPHTGQYFISFDDPRYMHHEVDADLYHHCKEGDEAFLYRGPKSKYVFNKNGNFVLM